VACRDFGGRVAVAVRRIATFNLENLDETGPGDEVQG
jgi:hypothetical protein